tara:strand:+ start:65 stop:1093 length:1029 start_codon:yes stop_codon:yes gene_type:complete
MIVSQRNGTSAVTTVNAYNIDHWQNAFSGTIGAYSFSQVTDSPDGFANSFKIDVTTADTSLGSTDVHYFRTALEGQDIQDFAKGTSSAKKFTLSFYVKTTKTGTYIVNLTDVDNSRECSASYTVSDTNWNRYTVSFPADTTGAFDNDNAVSLRVLFALSAGSSFQSGTLSTTWAAQADANRLVGQVNLADNTSNDWLITGIQLEVDHTGSGKATDFEHRSYADELKSCERYYQIIAKGAGKYWGGVACNYAANQVYMPIQFRTRMRASPSLVFAEGSSYYQMYDSGNTGGINFTRPQSFSYQNELGGALYVGGSYISGLSVGQASLWYAYNAAALIAVEAEL